MGIPPRTSVTVAVAPWRLWISSPNLDQLPQDTQGWAWHVTRTGKWEYLEKLTKSHARCTIRMLAQSSHVHWSHSPPAEKPVVSHLHLDNSPEMHFRWEKPWFWCCCYAFHKKRPAKLGEETNVSRVPPSDCSLNLG